MPIYLDLAYGAIELCRGGGVTGSVRLASPWPSRERGDPRGGRRLPSCPRDLRGRPCTSNVVGPAVPPPPAARRRAAIALSRKGRSEGREAAPGVVPAVPPLPVAAAIDPIDARARTILLFLNQKSADRLNTERRIIR